MDYFNTLEAVIERPELLAAAGKPAGLGRTGMLGFALGTLGLFTFFRLYAALPPGVMSFLLVLSFVLAGDLLLAAITHLFMELTGSGGNAARLFLAFGYSDFFMALLVPLAFFSKLNLVNAFLGFCLCLGLVLYARVRLVRRLYPVSANKAALSIAVPYAGFMLLAFLAFVYSLGWLVWLVM